MNDVENLFTLLEPLGLGGWQYHPQVTSTNQLALTWAREGAPNHALVVADTQTAGRGRTGRQWVTNPGAALAVSLIVRPTSQETAYFSRFTALAALGIIQALARLGLEAVIKWPNDILLDGKKVAGVLVEADWQAGDLEALVLGMGVNVSPQAVPTSDALRYPAISVVDAAGKDVDRWELLADTLQAMLVIRSYMTEEIFLQTWNEHLAFREQWVSFRLPGQEMQRMKIMGVTPDGWLSMETEDGVRVDAVEGEIGMDSH